MRYLVYLLVNEVCAQSRYIARAQAPRLLTSAPGRISVLLPTAPTNSSYVELQVRDCPVVGGEFSQLTVQVGDSPFSLTSLQPNSVCLFRARGVKRLDDQDTEEFVGPWSFFIPFRAAKAPEWATQELTMTQIGANTVRVSWPQPDNGGSPMTGYLLAMSESQTGTFETLFDGRTLATVQEYLITNLRFSTTYYFKLYAYNKVGPTNPPLLGVYTVGSSAAADRSLIPVWDLAKLANVKAGEEVSLTVNAYHPRTGQPEYLGGGCTIAADANCVPGRMFTCWLQDECHINDERSACERSRATAVTGSGTSFVPGALLPENYFPLASQDLNNGSHVLSFTALRTGTYSLVVQALWAGSLLGTYYDNALFSGSPVDTKTEAYLDHDWGTDAITRYSSDYVSVRWTGYIKVENADIYTFYCQVDDYCRVYLSEEQIIDAFTDDHCCGEFFSRQIELSPNIYYPIRIEYVEKSETAKISLLWSSLYYLPKAVIQSRFLFRGSFIDDTPYAVTVHTGAYDATESVIFGENLFRVSTNGMNEFYIQVKDKGGNVYDKYTIHEFLVKAAFTHLDGNNSFEVFGTIMDQNLHDGVYVVRFGVDTPGDYRVRVTLADIEVSNSPIIISVN